MTADISFSRILHFAQNAGLLSVLAKGPVKVEVQSLLRHSRYSIVFCSAHADFICVSRVILPNSLQWTVLMFVMETGYVLCEVGTGTLHAVCMNCRTPMIPPPHPSRHVDSGAMRCGRFAPTCRSSAGAPDHTASYYGT